MIKTEVEQCVIVEFVRKVLNMNYGVVNVLDMNVEVKDIELINSLLISIYLFIEFSDVSQSIHKDGFWQSLM